MNGKILDPISTMTDEQLAKEYMEIAGFTITPDDEPVEEPIVEEVPTKGPKFVFSFDMMDEDEKSGFVLDKLHQAMKEVFFEKIIDKNGNVVTDENGKPMTNSRMMARARFYVNGQDENGLAYGNFNGAGPRAITMYQPEHPEAGTGRNYGKVFYRWEDPRVEKLLDAIFKECGWDPKELIEEEGE